MPAIAPLPAAGATGLTDAQLRASAVPVSTADGAQVTVGAVADAEAASGNGTLVALLKRLRTLLNGGLPAALAAGGGLKVEGVAGGVAQPVSGTVTANAGTGPFPVSDNAGSLTVDATAATFGVNTAQVSGTAISVNNGTVDAGTQRVTLASNGTGVVGLAAGAATIGALTANQSVNLAQVAGTATSTGSRVTDAGVQSVFPAAPATANILVGHVAQTATTAAATVITVPINRTWVGTITITTDVAQSAAAAVAGQALGTVTTTGASVTPAAATVATCESRTGLNVATGLTGMQSANSITVPMVVSAGASALATIALASTQAGTNSRVACICSGYLI